MLKSDRFGMEEKKWIFRTIELGLLPLKSDRFGMEKAISDTMFISLFSLKSDP